MSNPKVSIIIPVFNSENLLKDCLKSVKNQTLNDIEIICVDDGSTDSSSEILDDFSKKDSRFKIFHQKNHGAGFSRNVALKKVTGEFILFLDSDDWIEKDTCEKLYYHAINLNSDVVLFDAVRHLPNNQSIDLIHFLGNERNKDFSSLSFDYKFIKDKVLNAYFGVIWSKFYKTSFIKENKIEFPNHKLYNDVEFHIKSLLLSKRISYYPKIFYHYVRIGQNSLQTVFVSSKESIVFYDVLCGVKKFLIENNFFDEFKVEFLEFTFKEFQRKLNEINDEFKDQYFEKIKSFLSALNLSINELNKISFRWLVFYIHIINSLDYDEFKFMEDNYDGIVDLDYEISLNKSDNVEYMMILENKLSYLTSYVNELAECLNLYQQKISANKKLINNIYYNQEELMRLIDANNYLSCKNDDLILKNKNLKKELDDLNNKKFIRLYKKIFKI